MTCAALLGAAACRSPAPVPAAVPAPVPAPAPAPAAAATEVPAAGIVAPSEAQTAQAVGLWVMRFYKAPAPELLLPYLQRAVAVGLVRGDRAASAVAFFATALQRYPDQAPAWEQAFAGRPEAEQVQVYTVLWQSGVPAAQALVRKRLGSDAPWLAAVVAMPPLDLRTRKPAAAADLDAHWGAFFASGDTAYLAPLLTVMARIDTRDTTLAPEIRALGGAARWSMGSLVADHPLLKTWCESKRDGATGTLGAALDEVLKPQP